MKVTEELLIEAAQIVASNETEARTETDTASVSCSGCGWGCSGIVGD